MPIPSSARGRPLQFLDAKPAIYSERQPSQGGIKETYRINSLISQICLRNTQGILVLLPIILCRTGHAADLDVAWMQQGRNSLVLAVHFLDTNCRRYDSPVPIVPEGSTAGARMRSLAAITIAFLSTTALAGAAEVFSVRDAILQAVTSNPGVGEAAANRRATETELRQVQARCCRKFGWKRASGLRNSTIAT